MITWFPFDLLKDEDKKLISKQKDSLNDSHRIQECYIHSDPGLSNINKHKRRV